MKKHLCYMLAGATWMLFMPAAAQNWTNGGNSLSADGSIGTNSNHALIFKTNNADRGRITNSGNWGIGTASPVGKFHVNGNGSFGSSVTTANSPRALNLADPNAVMRILRVHSSFAPAIEFISRTSPDGPNVAYWDVYAEPTDKSFRIRDRIGGGSGIPRLTITTANGYVGIGTLTPLNELHVVGRGRFTNGLTVEQSGVYSVSANGNGVEGYGNNSYGSGAYASGYYGVYGNGVGYGVVGVASTYGVYGSGVYGIYGSGSTYGVYGYSDASIAVRGFSNSSYGVEGASSSNLGGYFYSTSNYGMRAATGRADKNWAGVFDGNVYSFGAYQTSDKSLKRNVEDVPDAMGIITKLKPRRYEFRQDGSLANLHLPGGKHFGFIAQDIEEILPNLVQEVDAMPMPKTSNIALPKPPNGPPSADKQPLPAINNTAASSATEIKTIKSINYIEIIPLLVKGMQEQEKRLQEQEADNLALRKEVAELRDLILQLKNGGLLLPAGDWRLEQNSPNPVRTATQIRYKIPEGTVSARITITNTKGQQVKIVPLGNRGTGQVNIDVATLPSGIYHYSLLLDGKEVATKKLVISR